MVTPQFKHLQNAPRYVTECSGTEISKKKGKMLRTLEGNGMGVENSQLLVQLDSNNLQNADPHKTS